MKSKRELIISMLIKLVAIVSSIYGVVILYRGPMSFTYFTNISNILIELILGIFLVFDIVYIASKGEKNYRNNLWYIIKYMLTISITVTLLVYMFILAPTDPRGIMNAYFSNGAGSFCVHLLAPVLAIIDFFIFDYEYKSNGKHVVYAIIPPLCYVVYVVCASQAGLRWNGDMMAPYNFLNYGAPTGWFGWDISLMSKQTLGIGVAYMLVKMGTVLFAHGASLLHRGTLL